MLDNILHSKLYRPGSVAYVSRSGGMSNELNNIVSHGLYEGLRLAIGGDRSVRTPCPLAPLPGQPRRGDAGAAGRGGRPRGVPRVRGNQEGRLHEAAGGLVYRHLR